MKPKVKLVREHGNIFNLISTAKEELIKNGQRKEAKEMLGKITKARSHDDALQTIMEYVEVS